MKQNGNLKSNAFYNPNEARNPPPANMIDQERDSELEKFIRSMFVQIFYARCSLTAMVQGNTNSSDS